MNKIVASIAILGAFAVADTIGGELNIGYYEHTPSGTIEYKGDSIDLEDDFKWEKESDVFAKLYIEHPVPILPNIKLGYSGFKHSGSGVLTRDIKFANQTYTATAEIDSLFDLDMYDLTLYYEVVDVGLDFDLGLNVRYLDGSVSAVGEGGIPPKSINESTSFSLPIPMVYAKARVPIPATNIALQAEGNYISYSGNQFYDFEAGVRYTFALGLGLEGGYKTMKLKLDDVDDLTLDSTFSGAYAKLVWDF